MASSAAESGGGGPGGRGDGAAAADDGRPRAPRLMGSNPPAPEWRYRYDVGAGGGRSAGGGPSSATTAGTAGVLPVPFWFNEDSARRFRDMDVRDDDIVLSSGVKMGTTWLTRVLSSLLHEFDDLGSPLPGAEADRLARPNRNGQTYPEGLYADRPSLEADPLGLFGRVEGGREIHARNFGDFTLEDLLGQGDEDGGVRKPRLFSTHLFGPDLLPRGLFDGEDEEGQKKEGRGRLIVVARNLKDAMCSLHRFRGLSSDGWHGNGTGPGSFARYVSPDCPNGYGSAFEWVAANDAAVRAVGERRSLVVLYEDVVEDFPGQLRRINDFLGLGVLTERRAAAIEGACSMESMRAANMRTGMTIHRGGVGNWRHEPIPEGRWAEFDRRFEEVLGGTAMGDMMRRHMDLPPPPSASGEVAGRPYSVPQAPDVAMPPWFRRDTYERFRTMDVRDDDIFLSSGVKMGTTWVARILNCLLHDIDDRGDKTDMYKNDAYPNRVGQTYPEAVPPSRDVQRREDEAGEGNAKMRGAVRRMFGDYVLDDLLDQPAPRLFSSHVFGRRLLPRGIFGDEGGGAGRGRLIVVVRNLKDALVSNHHFRGLPKDGWFGNEHGPGSLNRWVDLESCPNAFGSAFKWIRESADAVEELGPDRALVIYYEALKLNFDSELRRINAFLGLPPLTEAKAQAVAAECTADSMRSDADSRVKSIVRKGVIGDWTNFIDLDSWRRVDEAFDSSIGDVAIARPLRLFHSDDVHERIARVSDSEGEWERYWNSAYRDSNQRPV